MKNTVLMAGFCLLLFACKKSTTTSTANSGQTSGQIASIRIGVGISVDICTCISVGICARRSGWIGR